MQLLNKSQMICMSIVEAMLIAATVIFISLAGIAHLERKGHDAKPSDEERS